MAEKKNGKKRILIAIIVAVAVVLAVVVVFFVFKKKKGEYRLLKVFEFDGEGSVEKKGKGKITPYNNMVLSSGDKVMLDTGKMTLLADDDKYIYFDQHTSIELVATGSKKNGKIKIELLKGGITNDIRNKLPVDSSYEVNTPNSTMSVRGTVFYVYIYEIDGVKYTRVCVFDGQVAVRLVYKDGTVDDEEVLVSKGKEVTIYEDEVTTNYLADPSDIDWDTLPDDVLVNLQTIITDGRDLSITLDELKAIIEGPYEVTFMYDGKEFATQTVKKGEKVSVPKFCPAATGDWDYDFDEPIEQNTVIEWQN
ncbi:FecR family protein [Lachnospiraceae bacterium RM5]|nr:FecR family protein [Lachnospiraceae bacterium RM5]